MVELAAGALVVGLLANLGFGLGAPLASGLNHLAVYWWGSGLGGLVFIREGVWAALLALAADPALLLIAPLFVLKALNTNDGPEVAVLFTVLLLGLLVPQLSLITAVVERSKSS